MLAQGVDACEIGPPPSGRHADTELNPNAIELLNWNIQKGQDPDWGDKLYALGRSANIITLQEAPLVNPGWEDHVADQFHAFAPGVETRQSPTGVMTASTAVPLVQCNLSSREPLLLTPKATIVTEYALAGRDETLLVINIHAVNFSLGMRAFVEQLGIAAAVLERHAGPVIFSGDFNTWRQARFDFVQEMIAAHGLTAVAFEIDERKRAFGIALDHVYIRGLKVNAAETYDTDTSDHNPMRVWLSN
jgi:endonuclease/exonuclease/phosphatase (EEP) superfamily protein YafD